MSTLYIAAAGAGKTTYMVDDAFRQSSSVDNKILITTFTDNNTLEIKQKFYSIYGFTAMVYIFAKGMCTTISTVYVYRKDKRFASSR